jgi:predicted Zn-dependent protease
VDEEPDPTLPPPTAPTYLPVTLWRAGTEQAMGNFSGDLVTRMIAAMKAAGGTTSAGPGLNSAGTVVLMQRVRLFSAPAGLTEAWGEDTDCEVTVTARTPDGKASGWSGQAHRDWTRLDPERVTTTAIDMAQRSRGAVRIEPGRYTAILGPAAVGALLFQMQRMFQVGAGVFSVYTPPMDDDELRMVKKTRLGERVFDSRISLWTDQSDPEGGDYPFSEYSGSPASKARWVDQGVLRMLAYPGQGVRFPWPPGPPPNIISMSGGTTTIAEMIAQCERGIYVNRLSEVDIVDFPSGTMQGTTRDGCFFIQNGKIHSAAANFRFYESPFLKFNNVIALGPSERVAFGFPPLMVHRNYSASMAANMWPTAPIVAPSMMVRDFNFSSLSDAV